MELLVRKMGSGEACEVVSSLLPRGRADLAPVSGGDRVPSSEPGSLSLENNVSATSGMSHVSDVRVGKPTGDFSINGDRDAPQADSLGGTNETLSYELRLPSHVTSEFLILFVGGALQVFHKLTHRAILTESSQAGHGSPLTGFIFESVVNVLPKNEVSLESGLRWENPDSASPFRGGPERR
jgi:hypothetical protein